MQNLFAPGEANLTYSFIDRMIVGGVCPSSPLALEGGQELGTDYFLQRRELGVDQRGTGRIGPGGRPDLRTGQGRHGLFVGQGAGEVIFASREPDNPAHFYLLSAPAHKSYPTQKITMAEAGIRPPGHAGTVQPAGAEQIHSSRRSQKRQPGHGRDRGRAGQCLEQPAALSHPFPPDGGLFLLRPGAGRGAVPFDGRTGTDPATSWCGTRKPLFRQAGPSMPAPALRITNLSGEWSATTRLSATWT